MQKTEKIIKEALLNGWQSEWVEEHRATLSRLENREVTKEECIDKLLIVAEHYAKITQYMSRDFLKAIFKDKFNEYAQQVVLLPDNERLDYMYSKII